MLSIQDFNVSEPDSDGDMRAEASFTYKNEFKEAQELILSGFHVLTSNGLVITSSTDEHEDLVESAGTVVLNASSSYFKDVAAGQSLRLLLNTVGCRCVYKDIGEFDILHGCVTGTADSLVLDEGFVVQGISVSAGLPDDDGDIMVEIKALVRNTTSLHTPRIKIEGSVKGQNGRVLDECSTYGESMMPSETRLLGASSYFKKSRLSGARVSIRMCLFIPSSCDQAMA